MATKKRRDSIGIFYELNHNEGKKYIYDHFKNCGLSKSAIYFSYKTFHVFAYKDAYKSCMRFTIFALEA